MSRQLKFRGKREDNGEWVYGYYVCLNEKEHRIYTGYAETYYGDYYPEFFSVDPETVGQYAGILDKNGVEIYEGDILLDVEFDENGNNISSKFPVVYDYSKCQFAIDNSFKKDGSNLVNFVEYFGIENLEVVGNIHDNIEMLFSF